MGDSKREFHWADYLLFGISLAIGIVVGFVTAVKDKWHQQSSESYLMGNRRMNWFLVAMSVLASIMTARLFVIFSAEFYYSGFIIIWVIGAYFIGCIYAAFIIIPKFFRLGFKITSAYEYFHHRFSLPVRLCVSGLYFLVTLFYMSVVLYIPSLVLAQVSVLNIYWCIFLGGCVCFFYTAFGGMRAVIWVDSIQILIIGIGMLALTIKGSVDAGGITAVWEKYKGIGERSNWDDVNPEPWNRYSVWNIIFMWGVLMMGLDGADQMMLQRYMTVSEVRKAQSTIIIATVLGSLFLVQTAILGVVMFASVGGNEPYLTHKIKKVDQIMPYFLMETLGQYHGIPGIVVASLFAASLSSLSSGETALVAVFLEDIIRPLYRLAKKRELSKGLTSKISKIVGVCVGLVVLGLSMVVPLYNRNILQVSLNIQSFVMGPFIGLFIVGLFMPWVETVGALFGMFASICWAITLWAGAQTRSQHLGRDLPPFFLGNFTIKKQIPESNAEPTLWDVSFTWYTFLDVCVVIIVANIVSMVYHIVRGIMKPGYCIPSTYPAKEFLYTKEDFFIAVGCKKPKPATVDHQDKDVTSGDEDTETGVDNPSFL